MDGEVGGRSGMNWNGELNMSTYLMNRASYLEDE